MGVARMSGRAGGGFNRQMLRRIREVWGDRLQPIAAPVLGPYVAGGTREFLTSVGLPAAGPWGITFCRDERLSAPLSRVGKDYLTIANDRDGVLYVVECGSERVWDLYPGRPGPTHFVNSDVALFVLFLGVFCALRPEVRKLRQEQVAGILGDLRQQIEAADPAAVGDSGTWWSVVLYETQMGYF
jgi:hypothetical protein